MTAILTDFEKLAEIAAQFNTLTTHVSTNASEAIAMIDTLVANTDALIKGVADRAKEDIALIEADTSTVVKSLEDQKASLIAIRGAFAEPDETKEV